MGIGQPWRSRDLTKVAANASGSLDAAWELFLERGLAALSIEAIASRAGVSKMTVYKHFSDKHALLEEAVLREARAIKTF